VKRNPYYLLRDLAGVPYLLPFGQSIASHDRGVLLNETGVFIWEQLEEERTTEELIALCAAHYGASEEELEELSSDLRSFLDSLVRSGALLPDQDYFCIHAPFYKNLRIAGITLRLAGLPDVFSERFDAFVTNDDAAPDVTISVCAGVCPYQNPGEAILRNGMMSVFDCGEYFEIQLHANIQLKECILKKDGTHAILYHRLPYNGGLKEEFFHGIREVFLYVAAMHGMVALHSTSILYRDKAWLFSGHSGMGKSTHARLWAENFGTPLINGDLNLLAMEDGKPVIHGIPWCGTSEISNSKTYPLGGITLLGRATTNFTSELSLDQQILLVDQRLISHSWTPALFDQNLEVIKKIAPEILICKLCCTKDPEAAIVMRKRIDAYLDNI